MKATTARDIVVVGAGLTGLTAAVLLARSGHRVTVLDRDKEAAPVRAQEAWDDWPRPGVTQFRQPHLMLPRWRRQMLQEFPELEDGLLAAGAQRVNLLHLQSQEATGGWQDGDVQFETLTARRPVLEATLCTQLAENQEGLVIRRGVSVLGLLADVSGGVVRVRGVRTDRGDIDAEVVVDAAGRYTRLPGWIADYGAVPWVEREPSGFIYYSRHYRSHDGRVPQAANPLLTHFSSMSVLTLPADAGTYCLVLVARADDRALRELRRETAWLAAVGCNPVASRWAAQGDPITPVMPIAGIEDIRRGYVRNGAPVPLGLFAVGDSSAATNPCLGRGASIGAIQACVLRDVLAGDANSPRELAEAYHEACGRHVEPWVEATLRFDRHRLAQMQAEIEGVPYAPADQSWSMTTALLRGAAKDPVLARAASRIGAMLALPPEVFADPQVRERIGPFTGSTSHPTSGPSRADLLQVIADARSSAKTPASRASSPQIHSVPTLGAHTS